MPLKLKVFFAILICVLSASSLAFAQETFSKFGITMQIPKGWLIDRSSPEAQSLPSISSIYDMTSPLITFTTDTKISATLGMISLSAAKIANGNITPRDYAGHRHLFYAAAGKVTPIEDVIISDLKGVRFDVTLEFPAASVKVTERHYFFIKNNLFVQVCLKADPEYFDKYGPVAEEVVSNLKIDNSNSK